MHDEHVRQRRDEAHRRELVDRYRAPAVFHQRRQRGERVDLHDQRIAVGARPRDDLRSDHRVSAGAVVDDHVLSERVAEVLRQRARDDVGAAARRERHDETYGS
jgi:hypothetical protein